MIQSAAIRTNKLLLNVIQKLPSPEPPAQKVPAVPASEKPAQPPAATRPPRPPTPTAGRTTTISPTLTRDREVPSPDVTSEAGSQTRSRGGDSDSAASSRPGASDTQTPTSIPSRPHSPASVVSQTGLNTPSATTQPVEERDPFDYQATVNELTIQFLSEFEETRVAALKWLLMLHSKAPKKVRVLDCVARLFTHHTNRSWLWMMGHFLPCSRLFLIAPKRQPPLKNDITECS